MHKCADPRLIDGVGADRRLDLLERARQPDRIARQLGARTRRPGTRACRDTIIASTCATIGATMIADQPDHHEDQSRDARAAVRCRRRGCAAGPPPHIMPRRAQSDSSATAPTSAATIVISRTSRLRMWLISCAMTPCSSSRSSVSSSPRVTAIDDLLGTAPGRERVRIRIRHDVDGRPRKPRRDRHLVDDVRELPELELQIGVAARRRDFVDRLRRRRQQHRAIAGEVAEHRRKLPTASASSDPTGTKPPASPM